MSVRFDPEGLSDDAMERAYGDLQAWLATSGYAQGATPSRQKLTKWKEWAGGHVERMMHSRAATVHYFESPQAQLRLAAAAAVADYWHGDDAVFVPGCLKLAFTDADPRVRGAALNALGWLAHYIDDPSGSLIALLRGPDESVDQETITRLGRQIGDLQRKLDLQEAGMKEGLMRMWERLAGSCLPELMRARASTETYLTHSDPKLRRAAISILFFHWGPTMDFAHICEKLALEDPDLYVRVDALESLIGCHAASDDARVGRLLARMVYDRSKATTVRKVAYEGLFILRGMPLNSWPRRDLARFDFPEAVDWAFVNTFKEPD